MDDFSTVIDAVKKNPNQVELYDAADLSSAEAASRTLGQTDVTSDPSSYNLFTQIQLDDLVESTTQAIILKPSTVGLFASQEAIYFSFGETLTELDKDSLTLDWRLMRSEDFSIWEEVGIVEIAVEKQDAPYFFRFELNQ